MRIESQNMDEGKPSAWRRKGKLRKLWLDGMNDKIRKHKDMRTLQKKRQSMNEEEYMVAVYDEKQG